MRIIITFLVFFSGTYAQTTNFQWAKRIGGNTTDYGNAIAVDAAGNVFTTGYFNGVCDFDPGPATYTLISTGGSPTGGSEDVFICKLDASGNFVWAKNMGGKGLDQAKCITLDAFGNIYTTGIFADTADFDPGPGVYNLAAPSCCGSNMFISKLDAFGNFVWAKQMTGPNANDALSIAIDALGNVFTTGYFSGICDFDSGPGTFTLNSLAGGYDVFILKLDASGNFIWAKQVGGISTDWGNSIGVDANGNVYVGGKFQGTPDFDPGPGTNYVPTFGGSDIFILKLNASGIFVWVKQMGGSLNDEATSIFVDQKGNVHSTGNFAYIADFDPGPGSYSLTSIGSLDVFVSKLDSLGNFIWAKQFGGTVSNSSPYSRSISVDATGNVYTVGELFKTVDFDPGPVVYNLTMLGNTDVFISKLDAAGNFVWAKQLGGLWSTVWGLGVAVDANNSVYTTGRYYCNSGWNVDFNEEVGTYTLTAAYHDVYVHKMDQSVSTDIDEAVEVKAISLFPNPSNGELNLIFGRKTDNTNIKLFNGTGQIVFEKNAINENKFVIDLSKEANGIYFLEVSDGNSVYRNKIIKN